MAGPGAGDTDSKTGFLPLLGADGAGAGVGEL